MTFSIVSLINIVYALLALSVIIAAHEFGHLIAAKKAGMKVERFGIGMGPPIFSIERGGTKYSLCWVPIGGFCQIKGEETENADNDSYSAKPPFQKFMVAFSGPFANFLISFVMMVIIFNIVGNPFSMKIGEVLPDQPASLAGLQAEDRLIGVNGDYSENTQEIIRAINDNPEQEILLHIKRNGEALNIPIIPAETERDGQIVGMIGIQMAPSYDKVSFFSSVTMSIRQMGQFFHEMLRFVGRWITGRLDQDVQVAGPVGIIGMAAETASVSAAAFIIFIAFLSLNLGMLNLFPIPPLDGGKILFALWEGVTKKPVNKKLEIWVNTAGFFLLISLIIFVTFKDILGFF